MDEGTAFLYSLSVGPGPDRRLRQVRTDVAAPIALHGRSDSASGFTLEGRATTPAGRGRVRLQWEVKPLGTPFDGTGTVSTPPADTGTPGSAGSGIVQSEPIAGLAGAAFHHWRTRTLSSDPFFPHSHWASLPGNGVTESKLRTAGCLDRDGDGRGDPNDPACVSTVADCNDHDALEWAAPGEVGILRFTANDTLVWDTPADPGAPASSLLYDVLRSTSAMDFLSGAVLCLESDNGPDTTAADAATPAVGQVYYYLVRAQDACPLGSGPLGFDSAAQSIAGRACGN